MDSIGLIIVVVILKMFDVLLVSLVFMCYFFGYFELKEILFVALVLRDA